MILISAEILKIEVLKCDAERLRYLAMDAEYDDCFHCQSRKDFIATLKKTPEQGFVDSYNYWFYDVEDSKMYEKVIDMWGDDIFNLYFVHHSETTNCLKNKVESTMKRIKNGEEII